jgi:prevent-host-death family protein
MKVTTKELRIQPGKIIDHVVGGQEVTITFRGKELAKIVPLEKKKKVVESEESIFGMWKDHKESKSVEDTVRELRKGRTF